MTQVELVSAAERPQADLAGTPFHRWTLPGGAPWTSFWRVEGGYLARFPGLADFEISLDGRQISVWRVPGIPTSATDNLYLNQAIPLALSRQGALILHACAIEIEERCVIFAGASGRGKSTLTASFATSGHRFLTDDGLHLSLQEGQLMALPSHPSIRLWADSQDALMPPDVASAEPADYTTKARFLADASLAYCPEPRRVHSLFFLGSGECDEVRIEPMRPQAALVELVRHSFLLDIDEHRMLANHFDEISRIANRGCLYHLDYPRRYDMLAELRRTIVDHIQEPAPS
jgi:hypothetical protein